MTGMGQYALHLWRYLRENTGAVTTKALIPAFAPPEVQLVTCGDELRGPTVPGPAKLRKLTWEQAGLPHTVFHGNIDLVHVPYFSAPLLKTTPYIVTIHDVIPLAMSAYHGSGAMQSYLALVGRSVRDAALILTDSEHSRIDIHRYLDLPLERIRSIPLAVSEEFGPAATDGDRNAINKLRSKLDLTRPFILNVGGYDVRKRLPELIEGYALALPQMHEKHDLVITGSPHTGNPRLYPPLEPIIRRWGLENSVHLTGFVSEQDKRQLYQSASLFVFTSAYEGFGLSPLEAMTCGAPVISSNRSSLPEVTGDAAILIDPDSRRIAKAIIETINDQELRRKLAHQSLARASQFSWDRTARGTMNAYIEVGKEQGLMS